MFYIFGKVYSMRYIPHRITYVILKSDEIGFFRLNFLNLDFFSSKISITNLINENRKGCAFV